MEKDQVISNICTMLKMLDYEPLRAVYMIVRELYRLQNGSQEIKWRDT